MRYKVFKFGGASVKDAPAIENLHNILRRYPDDHIIVVISAMGKTTNFLEKVLHAYYHNPDQVEALVSELEQQHKDVALRLVPDPGSIFDRISELFGQLRAKLDVEHSNN